METVGRKFIVKVGNRTIVRIAAPTERVPFGREIHGKSELTKTDAALGKSPWDNADNKTDVSWNSDGTKGYINESGQRLYRKTWHKDSYPALRHTQRRRRSENKTGENKAQNVDPTRRSHSRNIRETRSRSRSTNHAPYYRSKSVCSTVDDDGYFRPVVNEQEVINSTYTGDKNIERTRSRSSSSVGFARKKVTTVPFSRQESYHREMTELSKRFVETKDVYTERNRDTVANQFYKNLADVKKEEYKRASQSSTKQSKQKQKTLLNQIEDLKRLNSKYRRTTEQRYNAKFSTYHPTNAAARAEISTSAQNKSKNSHDFSKWRYKQINMNSSGRIDKDRKQRQHGQKGYRGPQWERQATNMQRLLSHEQNEGSTRDNSSGQMREMLHEAEAMLDMVEKRFPKKSLHSKATPEQITNQFQKPSSWNKSKDITTEKSNTPKLLPEIKYADYRHKHLKEKTAVNLDIAPKVHLSSDKTLYNVLRDNICKNDEKRKRVSNKHSSRFPVLFHTESLKESMKHTKRANRKSHPIIIRTGTNTWQNDSSVYKNSLLPIERSLDQIEQKSKLSNKIENSDDIIKTNYRLQKQAGASLGSKLSEPNDSATSKSDRIASGGDVSVDKNQTTGTEQPDITLKDTQPLISATCEAEVLSPPQIEIEDADQRRATSGYLIRIQKVKNIASEHMLDCLHPKRTTPNDLLKLSRQSFNKSPLSKPGSAKRPLKSRNEYSDRILITPVSLKNQEKGFLVTNCRIFTPDLEGTGNNNASKMSISEETDGFFITGDIAGTETSQIETKNKDNRKESNVISSKRKTDEYITENIPKQSSPETLIGLQKWKAMVKQYLTDYEST